MDLSRIKESTPLQYGIALAASSVIVLSLAKFTNWRKLNCVVTGTPPFIGVALNQLRNYYAEKDELSQLAARCETLLRSLPEQLTNGVTQGWPSTPPEQDSDDFIMFMFKEGDDQRCVSLSLQQVREGDLTETLRQTLERLRAPSLGQEVERLRRDFEIAWGALGEDLTRGVTWRWPVDIPTQGSDNFVFFLAGESSREVAFSLSLEEVGESNLGAVLRQKMKEIHNSLFPETKTLEELRAQLVNQEGELQAATSRLDITCNRLQQSLTRIKAVYADAGVVEPANELVDLLNQVSIVAPQDWDEAVLDEIQSRLEAVIQAIRATVTPPSYLWLKFEESWAKLSEELTAGITYRAVEPWPDRGDVPCVVLEKEGRQVELTVEDVRSTEFDLILEWEVTRLQDPTNALFKQLLKDRFEQLGTDLGQNTFVDLEGTSMEGAFQLNEDDPMGTKLGVIRYLPAAITPQELHRSETTTRYCDKSCPESYFTEKWLEITVGDMRQMAVQQFVQRYRPMVEEGTSYQLVDKWDWPDIAKSIQGAWRN